MDLLINNRLFINDFKEESKIYTFYNPLCDVLVPSENRIDYAAEKGLLHFIKLFHANGESCTEWAMNLAAEYGHLLIVKWLHENRMEGCTTWAIDMAAKNGHLDVVKWLYENRKEGCTSSAMILASENGHLLIVKFLFENYVNKVSPHALTWAVRNGHDDVSQFLRNNYYPNDLD